MNNDLSADAEHLRKSLDSLSEEAAHNSSEIHLNRLDIAIILGWSEDRVHRAITELERTDYFGD